MRVVDHLNSVKNPTVSVEIIPPRRGRSLQKIHDAIESIQHFKPPFIDVTSHSAEVSWEEMKDGTFNKVTKRKAPGTFGLCAAIKYKFNIEPVPHMLCAGFTREETEDALIELNYLGIENVLAIKGDAKFKKKIAPHRSENIHASDLVGQINNMNTGKYLDDYLVEGDQTNFCVGVAAYPEKHFESPNVKYDLEILKKKQEMGAHYAVTQMFFDTKKYFEFVSRARDFGITLPIIPGMKILTRKKQLSSIPRVFFVDIPEELCDRVMAAKTREKEVEEGINWALRQSIELLEGGVPYLHFYIMQNTAPFVKFMDKLKAKV